MSGEMMTYLGFGIAGVCLVVFVIRLVLYKSRCAKIIKKIDKRYE